MCADAVYVHMLQVAIEVQPATPYVIPTPSYAPCSSKSQLCAELNAAVLIDDSAAYAREAARVVPNVFLFGRYPWNANAREAGEEVPATAAEALSAPPAPVDTPLADDDPNRVWQEGANSSTPLPANVVRAINWRHVSALLSRLRPASTAAPATPSSTLDRPTPQRFTAALPAGGRAPTLPRRDVLVSERHGAGYYADAVRRSLEVSSTVAISGAGADTRQVVEASSLLVAARDAEIVSMRTGADAAPPGAARPPRITVELRRSPTFLERRFNPAAPLPPQQQSRSAPSPTLAVAAPPTDAESHEGDGASSASTSHNGPASNSGAGDNAQVDEATAAVAAVRISPELKAPE